MESSLDIWMATWCTNSGSIASCTAKSEKWRFGEALPSSLSSFKRRQPQLFSSSLLLSIMGVRGLTTYLRENRKSLTRSTKFETSQDPHQERVALVIDAWSLIYTLCFTLRWSYGGEHLEYARLLERVFSAFRAVGLEPVMVFDGTSRSSYVVLDSVDI
jgi:hypothetical protein